MVLWIFIFFFLHIHFNEGFGEVPQLLPPNIHEVFSTDFAVLKICWLHPSSCSSIRASSYPSSHPSMHPLTYPPIYLFIHPCILLHILPSILQPFSHSCIHPSSVHLSIHPSLLFMRNSTRCWKNLGEQGRFS